MCTCECFLGYDLFADGDCPSDFACRIEATILGFVAQIGAVRDREVEGSLPTGIEELPRIPMTVLFVLSALELQRESPEATVSAVTNGEQLVLKHPVNVLRCWCGEAGVLAEPQRLGCVRIGRDERAGGCLGEVSLLALVNDV